MEQNPYEPTGPVEELRAPVKPALGQFVGVIVCFVICWGAFCSGLDLTFRDMFGGPAPPETLLFFILSWGAGFVGVVLGVRFVCSDQGIALRSVIAVLVLLMLIPVTSIIFS